MVPGAQPVPTATQRLTELPAHVALAVPGDQLRRLGGYVEHAQAAGRLLAGDSRQRHAIGYPGGARASEHVPGGDGWLQLLERRLWRAELLDGRDQFHAERIR